MPRQRTPKAKAELTGQADKHPERFKNRKEPKVARIGEPSAWMTDKHQLAAWAAFVREIPWLGEADRAFLEGACILRAKLLKGDELGVQALGQLRLYLNDMGATPAARSKIADPDDEKTDPLNKFLN